MQPITGEVNRWSVYFAACPAIGLFPHFGILGYVIIGIFVLSWVGSVLFYKFKRYDELEIKVVTS